MLYLKKSRLHFWRIVWGSWHEQHGSKRQGFDFLQCQANLGVDGSSSGGSDWEADLGGNKH